MVRVLERLENSRVREIGVPLSVFSSLTMLRKTFSDSVFLDEISLQCNYPVILYGRECNLCMASTNRFGFSLAFSLFLISYVFSLFPGCALFSRF